MKTNEKLPTARNGIQYRQQKFDGKILDKQFENT